MASFTLADLASKSTEKSGYIAIDGKVYDVTKYMDSHPGGEELIQEVLGQDATEAFHEVGHSQTAMEQLVPLYVGTVEVAGKMRTKESSATKWTISSVWVWLMSVFGVAILAVLAASMGLEL